MSILSEEIQARLNVIRKQIPILEQSLCRAPKGRLRVSTNGTNARFYQIIRDGDHTGRYLRRSEEALAEKLAQKGYDKRVLTMLRKEEFLLAKLENYYIKASEKTDRVSSEKKTEQFFSGPEELLWKKFIDARKNMVMPITPDTETFIAEWLSEDYEKKEFRSTDAEFYSGSGIRVRSKTELIIANMLEKRNIPFYYERPLELKGQGIIHPDFTVLNVKRRKTFYWEHMGMMDDENYRDHALERINHYILSGHYPGIDLILTHETAARPVKTQILEKIVEAYLEA